MTTVRNQIIRAIRTRLESATLGGVDVGLVDFEDQLEETPIAEVYSKSNGTPKHVLEIVVGDDEGPGVDGVAAQEAIAIDRLKFTVLIVVHMAEAPDPSENNSSWTELAGEIHNDLYQLYTTVNGEPDQSAETWGGFALETHRLSGGNLFLNRNGARATSHVMEVVYRHTYGKGSEAR